MEAVCVLVSIAAIFIGKYTTKRWCNLLSIMGLLHAATVFFAAIRLMGYYKADSGVYLMITIGMLSFTVAYFIAMGDWNHRHIVVDKYSAQVVSNRYTMRRPLFLICFAVLIIFTLQKIIDFLSLISRGLSLSTIRLYYFNPELAEGTLGTISFSKNATVTYFYLPCLYVLTLVAIISIFQDLIGKNRRIFIITIFLCDMIYCLTSGGRNLLFTIGLMFIFCFHYFRRQEIKIFLKEIRQKKIREQKKRKKILIGLLVLLVVFMLALSSMRVEDGGATKSFAETIYQYFCGYIPYTSYFYESFTTDDYTYGWMFISCFIKPFTNLIQSVLGINFPEAYRNATILLEQFSEHVRISPYLRTNGYVSVFYCFYTDFGYLSVLIESALFGVFCALIEAKNIHKPNQRSLMFYLLWFYVVIWSGVRWYLLSVHIMISFYLVLLLFKKQSQNKFIGTI